MTKTIRYTTVIALVFAIISMFVLYPKVKANPSYFVRGNNIVCGQGTASTSISYMTAGTATTTYTIDTGCAGAQGADSAVLLAQFTASSTSSKLHIDTEYSQDNITWYQNDLSSQATTTSTQDISAEQDFNWNFASSTEGFGAISSTTNRTSKVVTIPTPTRYARTIFSIPAGAAAGGIWAEFVAKRQAN